MESPEQALSSLLREVPRLWRAVVDRRLRPVGLSQAKWRVLYFASRQAQPITQTELAEYLGIEAPSLARLLDRLADDGWIVRRRCPGDRRLKRVELTAKARKVSTQIEAVVHEVRQCLLTGIEDAELWRCVATLEQIKGAAESELTAEHGGAA